MAAATRADERGDGGQRDQTITAAEGSARRTCTRSVRSGASWGSRILPASPRNRRRAKLE
jgi:hypothetical protein